MKKNQLNLIYAIKNGQIISVEDVESGVKCQCTCPACGEQLVAKKGKKMAHHFAHYAGHNCEYGYETSLHLAAKEIISKAKSFYIPPVYLEFPHSYKKHELISEAKEVQIDRVELEKRYDGFVPDIVIYAGGKQLLVEIYVTHCIDETKLEKLQAANISTIEIDLNKKQEGITAEYLKSILLRDCPEKTWKFNAKANLYYKQFCDRSDKRKLISRGLAIHIDDCPIKSRVWHGKPYANFMHECIYCEYCVSHGDDNEMLCSGRLGLNHISDLAGKRK